MRGFAVCLGVVVLGLAALPVQAACDARETYFARLSAADHYNSNGQRLTSPAAIIRQDRANFHLYGIRDPEDQNDAFFASKENRAILERLLERGEASSSVIDQIVNGTPLIEVSVCRGNGDDYIRVRIR